MTLISGQLPSWRATVLVVEDDPDLCRVFVDSLSFRRASARARLMPCGRSPEPHASSSDARGAYPLATLVTWMTTAAHHANRSPNGH